MARSDVSERRCPRWQMGQIDRQLPPAQCAIRCEGRGGRGVTEHTTICERLAKDFTELGQCAAA
jgi:hypothetical protein